MGKSSSEKKRGHVVAWINKAEWDQVLEYLYSQDVALQRFAVHRISAWKSRYANSTPVAVDCTADLVRCQVLDRSGQLTGDDLVMLYGTALVRFVNLITERKQGMVAKPLRRLAGKLNIPEWVVDLRHEFTHKKLPTLKWCRKGCKVVLEWLHQTYWSRQLGGGPDADWDSQSDGEDEDQKLLARQKEVENYKTARELLISYEKDRFRSVDELQEDMDRNPSPLADLSWLLGEIKQFALECMEMLVDVLVEDGFLVPTVEQLETLDLDPSETSSPTEPRVPQVFLRFWLPLLKMLNSPSFIHLLLEKLFEELKLLAGKPDPHRTFYLSAWVSELVLCNSNRFEYRFEPRVQKKARAKDRIFVNRIQLQWRQLLSACLGAPCVGTPRLLQLILDDMEPPLPLETQQNLLRLCSIYTQTAPPDPGSARAPQQQRPIYTLESLHEKHGQLWRSAGGSDQTKAPQELKWAEVLAEKAKALRGSPWQVCSDKVLWKNYPLGKVPGQSDDPSWLMVETFSPMTVFDQPVDLDSSGTQTGPGTCGPTRTAEGLLWSQSDISRLKSGLKLF